MEHVGKITGQPHPPMGSLAWERAGGPALRGSERAALWMNAAAAVSQTWACRALFGLGLLRDAPRVDLSTWAPPDSALAKEAEALVRACTSSAVVEHSLRAYWFAAILAERAGQGSALDREGLYVAALLHDVCLAGPRLGTERCFTVASAREARRLMTAAGWEEARQDAVAAAIVSNLNIRVPADEFGAVAHAFTVGGMVEVLAQEWKVHPENLAEILARHPRTNYATDVLGHVAKEATLDPGGRFACLGAVFPFVARRAEFSASRSRELPR